MGTAGPAGGGAPDAARSSDCGSTALSPQERQLCQDSEDTRTFNNTVLGGAALGAGLGALVGGIGCLLAHGNTKQCIASAGGGAVVGGIAGGIDGYVTAKRQEAARQRVRAIDAVTNDVRMQNARLQRSVQNAQAVVDADTDRLAQIDGQRASGQLTLEQAMAERAKAENNKQKLDQLIASVEESRNDYQKAAVKTSQYSPDFNAQIQQMNMQIAALTQQRDTLDHALAITSIN